MESLSRTVFIWIFSSFSTVLAWNSLHQKCFYLDILLLLHGFGLEFPAPEMFLSGYSPLSPRFWPGIPCTRNILNWFKLMYTIHKAAAAWMSNFRHLKLNFNCEKKLNKGEKPCKLPVNDHSSMALKHEANIWAGNPFMSSLNIYPEACRTLQRHNTENSKQIHVSVSDSSNRSAYSAAGK